MTIITKRSRLLSHLYCEHWLEDAANVLMAKSYSLTKVQR